MAEYEDIDERNVRLQIQVSLLEQQVTALKTVILMTADALHKMAKALEDMK